MQLRNVYGTILPLAIALCATGMERAPHLTVARRWAITMVVLPRRPSATSLSRAACTSLSDSMSSADVASSSSRMAGSCSNTFNTQTPHYEIALITKRVSPRKVLLRSTPKSRLTNEGGEMSHFFPASGGQGTKTAPPGDIFDQLSGEIS